jgi:hypothetical protein
MARKCSAAFLLGAGVSLPTAPATANLTEMITEKGDEYFLHTDERWYRRATNGDEVGEERKQRSVRVKQLIARLRTLVNRYYVNRQDPAGCLIRQCTYEDVAYLADSIANTLNRERDDPGLIPLVEELQHDLRWDSKVLGDAADDAIRFVRDVVQSEVSDLEPPQDYLRILCEACKDEDISPTTIYTLNHDCLLEDMFRREGVLVHDYLQPDASGRLVLRIASDVPQRTRAVLYKLHGSIRWHRFRPLQTPPAELDPWFTEWIGNDRDSQGRRHDDGREWRSLGGPLILVGRFNKELNYLDAPYWQLFAAFQRSLETQQVLVVSGYSFGDKAINAMLIDWVYSRQRGERTIIVMHADEAALVNGARGAIRSKWQDWRAQSILTTIPCWLGDYSWEDLKRQLGD